MCRESGEWVTHGHDRRGHEERHAPDRKAQSAGDRLEAVLGRRRDKSNLAP
jgi:hypothetical protein